MAGEQVATKIPFMSILRWIPRLLAIIYALIIIGTSFSVAMRQGDARIFLIDGVGQVVVGADNQLYNNIMDMKAKALVNEASILDMLNVLSPFLILYYVIKALKWGISKILSKEEAELPKYLISFAILFFLQTLFYSVTQGKLILGFTGLATFFLNLDVFFAPIYPTGIFLGNASIQSPLP